MKDITTNTQTKTNKTYYTVQEYAKLLHVHPQTLRRYTRQGLVTCERTLGNHRRFVKPSTETEECTDVVGYVRVSSHDQKKDLVTQESALTIKAKEQGVEMSKVISDIGSGLNYKKRGFKILLNLILTKKIGTLVLMHKDRLLRFGSEIIFKLCESFNIKVIILEEPKIKSTMEQLCMDLVEIITVFSSKLYGMRSRSNTSKLIPSKI